MTAIELSKTKKMLLILALNIFLTFQFSIYSSIITAYEKFIFQKIMAIINTILKPIIMIPVLLLGYKSIALTVVLTIINIFILISNYIFCRKKLNIEIKYCGFDKQIFNTILKYSIWVFLAVIVDKVNWSLDNFILGAVSGTIAVSIYSIAATLNHLFINLSTAISSVFLPKMSKMIAKNATSEELTNEMIKVGRIQNYIIFLMCSGLILFGKNFIISWAGKEFETSYYVSLLLIIPICIPLIQNLGISIMQAMNKFQFKSIITFITAIINVIISIFLAKKLGAIGAAMGTSIALIVCNIIIINIYYHRSMKINMIKFWKNIILQSIPFFIPIVIIILIMNITSITGIKGFISYGGIYTILYGIIAYFLSTNKYEKDLIRTILSRFLKKVHQ